VRRSPLAAVCCALSAMFLGASGCHSVGPDYRGPPRSAMVNSPAVRGAFLSATGSAFSPAPVPTSWWRLYDSAALDALVEEGLAANTDLRQARANLELSAALLRAARAQRQPSVEVNLDSSYQQLSAESYLYPGSLSPGGLYDTGLSVSYEVDLFGRLRRAIEAAGADDEAAKAAYELAQVTAAAEVARAYAEVCNAGEQLTVANRSVHLQLQSVAATRRLVVAGRASRLDLTRSTGLLAQIRASIPRLEAERTNALYRLAALTGRPPAQYPRSVESCSRAPRLLGPLPVGDATALLRRRPDVREAERLLAGATARIGVATAELYPRIVLGFSVGSTGALTDFLTSRTDRYGAGLGVHWQANPSAARARVSAAGARARGVLAQLDGIVLVALRDTEVALSTYSHDLQSDGDLSAAQARASEAEQEAERLYRGGKIDFLSLLDAQRTRDATDEALAGSHARLATDQVAIFLALGGGWQ